MTKPIDTLVAVSLSAAASMGLFSKIRGYALVDWDSYPQIASARVSQLSDFLETFAEETSDGVYPHSFYRPIFNLSLAIDHALWGIDPLGYHVTDALLTFFGAIAVFVLARRLLGADARVGAFAALATYLLLPVHIEMMSAISRRMDLLCGLFVTLALAVQLPRLQSRRPTQGLLPAFLTALAVGAKEAGVIVVPLVMGLAAFSEPNIGWRARLRRSVVTAAPHAAAVALVFSGRFYALGEIGGHPSTDLMGFVTRLPWALGWVVIRLSAIVPTTDQPTDGMLPYVVSGLTLIFLFGLIARLVATTRPARRDARASSCPPADSQPLITAVLGLAWMVTCSAIYGATGLLQPWYLLMPALGLVQLVGATAEQLTRSLRTTRSIPATLALGLLAIWIGWQARYSPLIQDYTQWDRATRALDRYLGELAHQIEMSSDGMTISVPFPPIKVPADPNPTGSHNAPVIHVYSLHSWAKLRFPERRIEFRGAGLADQSKRPIAGGVVIFVREPAARVFRAGRRSGRNPAEAPPNPP